MHTSSSSPSGRGAFTIHIPFSSKGLPLVAIFIFLEFRKKDGDDFGSKRRIGSYVKTNWTYPCSHDLFVVAGTPFGFNTEEWGLMLLFYANYKVVETLKLP